MPEVSLPRIYTLRALYLFIFVGLAVTVWPGVLRSHNHWETMEGFETCMLTAFSLLCALGLRYPVKMIPVLLWECAWKTLWLLLVPLPQWHAGHLDPALIPNLFAVGMVVLVYLAVPWGYVYRTYLKTPGDRWR